MDKKNDRGIFETIRQVDEKERRDAEKKQEEALRHHEKQREEYAKELAEDKVELLKIKQGLSDESRLAAAEGEEEKHYTIPQRIGNFIYSNKWWLGIASFLALLTGFLIYDTLTVTRPDVKFMLLNDSTDLYGCYDNMLAYFDSLAEDYNKDGEVCSDVLYIPISDEEDVYSGGIYESNLSRLSAEFQLGETLLVIADSRSEGLVVPDMNLADLEKLYPDTKGVKGYGFYLKDTPFARRIGFEGEIPEDMYIGIRKVTDTLTSAKDMQKNYDKSMEVLDRIIADLSK